MPATTYQINRNLRGGLQEQKEAMSILASVAENAVAEIYRFNIVDVSLDGSGRLRIRLSDAFPQAEVDSFNGDIIPL
jgi:hypothetical protein